MSQPDVILPTPLQSETYEDIPSLSAMPPMYVSYWQHFGDHQFNDDFGSLPDDLLLDFWCTSSPSLPSSSSSSGDDDPNTDDERDIHVINHPTFIDHNELCKGVIIAVRPYQNYYDDHPDETPENFWLAKIISRRCRGQNWSFKVCWFNNETVDDENVPSKYILDESETVRIPYGSILYHNIELTQRHNLRQNIFNKIMNICNE